MVGAYPFSGGDYMPTTKFICPNGQRIRIADCLRSCPNNQRCMFLPTLRAVAKSLDRKITEPTVTELIAGVRETYLKKTSAYAVDPASILYALQGQAIHSINEQQTQGAILSEERLNSKTTSRRGNSTCSAKFSTPMKACWAI